MPQTVAQAKPSGAPGPYLGSIDLEAAALNSGF